MARVLGYLNSFRTALPVAFPATRRPTRWKSTGLFVGEGRFSALVPSPPARVVSALEWDHVVYVQPGVRVKPLPLFLHPGMIGLV